MSDANDVANGGEATPNPERRGGSRSPAPDRVQAAEARATAAFAFDLSTSARWSGIAVGIVRVERELARRAAAHLGAQLTYCLYDLRRNVFCAISHDTAEAIVEGRLQIDFEPGVETRRLAKLELLTQVRAHLLNRPRLFTILQALRGRKLTLEQAHQLRVATGAPTLTFRRIGREYLIMNARLYQAVQRLRGRSLSLAQIAQIRAEEARGRVETAQQPLVKLDEVSTGDLPLGPDTVIISGGLDWEYKNVRGIHKLKKAYGFRYAAILYDLIPLNLPQYVVPHYVNLLADYFGELFWTADFAMCISRKTQEDALDYCAKNSMTPPAMAHFPLGGDLPPADDDAAPVELPSILAGKRYALFVSTIEPRKNHRTLYEAWSHAIEQGRIDPETCRLVFVGRAGWNTGELLHEIRVNPVTKNNIVILEGISDAMLNALYASAEFGLFPSRYEGYGLPLAEMLGHGLPCIVSPAGSLPEVGGALVIYRDPIDIAGWSDDIARFFAEPQLLAAHRKAIHDQYEPVSWEGAATAFFDRLVALVNP